MLRWWPLVLAMGCFSVHPGVDRNRMNAHSQSTRALVDAQQVLELAARSEDPALRAQALSLLVATSDDEQWLNRAWMDPSHTVQRAIAQSHPFRLSDAHLLRPGADGLAVGWVLAVRTSPVQQIDWTATDDLSDDLVRALCGNEASQKVVLGLVREGMVPPEPLLVNVLARSGLPEMGSALAEGAMNAEDEMRLPMALAAQDLAPEAGRTALVEVLRGADEMTRLFAVEALTRLGDGPSLAWLRRAAHGEPGAVREHARMGLVALGVLRLDVAVEGLSSSDRDQRAWAAACLGLAGVKRPLPRGVVAALQSTWRDESDAVRRSVTQALLVSVGPGAVPVDQTRSPGEPDAVSVMVSGKWIQQDKAKSK